MTTTDDPTNLLKRAEQYTKDGEYDKSIGILEKLLNDNPGDVGAVLLTARTAQAVRNFPMAEKYYELAFELSGANIDVRQALMIFHFDRGQHDSAIIHARVLIEGAPERGEYLEILGTCLITLDNYPESLEVFQKLVALYPDSPQYLLRLCMCLDYFRDKENRWDEFFAFEDLAPDLLITAGNFLLQKQHFTYARVAYDRYAAAAGQEDKLEAIFHTQSGDCLFGLGLIDEARIQFKKALDLCYLELASDSPGADIFGVLLYAQYRYSGEESTRQTYREVLQVTDGVVDFSNSPLPDDNGNRIKLLQEICRGKDVVILLPGPSIGDFSDNIEKLRSADCVFFGLNEYHPIEVEILSKIERVFDGVMQSNPFGMRQSVGALLEFMERPDNILIANLFCLMGFSENPAEKGKFSEKYADKLLMFNSNRRSSPSPFDPLQMMGGNTLSALVAVLILGLPKRILIFGADSGGVPTEKEGVVNDETTYYFAQPDDIPYAPSLANDRLVGYQRDAVEMAQIMQPLLIGLSAMFDVPVPPVLNCCSHSLLDVFEKIEAAAGIDLIVDG